MLHMYDYQLEPLAETDASPVKVVVADDDALQRAYISAILKKLGYEAHEAADGRDALRMMHDLSAKVLVCDLDMPGMNGHELARKTIEGKQRAYCGQCGLIVFLDPKVAAADAAGMGSPPPPGAARRGAVRAVFGRPAWWRLLWMWLVVVRLDE